MIVIIDYGLGNLFSVYNAFKLLGIKAVISSKPDDIKSAERLVLPGVGAFGDGIANLKRLGLDRILTTEVIDKKKPFLGICLGLQLLADRGFEYGEHQGLGWIRGEVRKLDVEKSGLKLPHIGWNSIKMIRPSSLLDNIQDGADFYFLNSYHLVCENSEDLVAVVPYGEDVTAIIQRQNIFGAQFHPEKSQSNGLKLLENFINWKPQNA